MKLKTLVKNTNRKVSYTEVLTTQWILPTKASKKKENQIKVGLIRNLLTFTHPAKDTANITGLSGAFAKKVLHL